MVSPGRTQSCPLVATWPEGRGSADPCVPRRPRQTQAPSHSYPADREETDIDTKWARKTMGSMIQRWRVTTNCRFQCRSYFTWGMPEAGGCQVVVTMSVQVNSAAEKKKTQPSSDLNTEMKTGREKRRSEIWQERKRRRGYNLPKVESWEGQGVELFSHVATLQLSASQPGTEKNKKQRGEGRRKSDVGSTEATLQII